MIDKAGHVAGAAEAVAVFQRHCGTSDEHALADLICDLGHLADARGSELAASGQPSIQRASDR